MAPISIGLVREGRVPPDKRAPFSPLQVEEIQQRFSNVKVFCQASPVRCLQDDEYAALGIDVMPDVGFCDILMGIKEVPVSNLIPDKTYLFFSHTLKRQPHNRKLLQKILELNIRLIDYEAFKDIQGNRLVAFGRFAGIVGAYNALWTYGKRYGTHSLRRAYECFDINDLKLKLRKVKLPAIKIVLTGAGRVAKGAMETLDTAGIRKVSAQDFLSRQFQEAVYVQLSSADYHSRIEGGHFNREEFHQHPELYNSDFVKFTKVADILMAGAYLNPKAPKMFTRENMLQPNFKIKIVADITCDIDGSVPTTKKPRSITDTPYDHDASTENTHSPLSNG